MASGQERILRRRIRSVQSTKKITRAMELIAASRIVKAQQRVAAARPYSEQITEVIRTLADAVIERYEEGDVDQVQLVFTRFLSVGSQRVVNRRLLPLETESIVEARGEGPQADYEYEPEPEEILERLVPRYVEARVFSAMLEAAASEHAARQRAMKSATDNADELIKNLSVVANKLRQASITTEIMEIVGGAEALRQAGLGDEEDLLPDFIVSRDIFRDILDPSGVRR